MVLMNTELWTVSCMSLLAFLVSRAPPLGLIKQKGPPPPPTISPMHATGHKASGKGLVNHLEKSHIQTRNRTQNALG